MKKQFKVYLVGKILPQSQGWRTVHAKDKKEAKEIARKKYPNCSCEIIEEIKLKVRR